MFAYTMNVLLPEALILVAMDKFDINQEAVSGIQDLPVTFKSCMDIVHDIVI